MPGKVSYILKEPTSDKVTAIMLLYSCADGRLKYYTGESIHPDHWHIKAQTTDKRGIKAQLHRITKAVEQFMDSAKEKGIPVTRSVLKHFLDQLLKQTLSLQTTETFYSEACKVLTGMKSGKILTDSKKPYTASTVKALQNSVEVLYRFNPGMITAAITINTYHDFIVWSNSENYSTNYTGAVIKSWKRIGKLIGTNPVFDDKQFKKLQEQVHKPYLDEDELTCLAKLDLKDNKRYEVVRDWFILDCYTGLRVSDLVQLSDYNYENGMITIANEKTGAKVIIPEHPRVKAIIKKYKGFPPKVSDVEINRIIKIVCKTAKINSSFLLTMTKGGRRKDQYLKKWQMIGNHTARRSFITNLMKEGVPDSIVMKLTGIKSLKTLQTYLKLQPDEAARIAAGLDFFKRG